MSNCQILRPMEYDVEDFTVEISTDEYIRLYLDADRFIEYCKACPNYGNLWACPPFNRDTESELRQYEKVLLIATKITPHRADIPIAQAQQFIIIERKRLEKSLLEMEKEYGGRSFAFVGKCLYCAESDCTRKRGLPCRHPELVRPSLEAYGFDMEKTASNLFGIKILWSKTEFIPEYLTLICGFFHNYQDKEIIKWSTLLK